MSSASWDCGFGFLFEVPEGLEPPVPGVWLDLPLSLPVGVFEFVCLWPPDWFCLPGAGLFGVATRIVAVPPVPLLGSATSTVTL